MMDAYDSGELTAADVHDIAFGKPPFGERGYNEDDVDDFLEAVELRLTNPRAVPRPTAADAAAIAFGKPPIGKRGYCEDEVDAFVVRVERQLARVDVAPPEPPPQPGPTPRAYEAPSLDAPPRKKWWQRW